MPKNKTGLFSLPVKILIALVPLIVRGTALFNNSAKTGAAFYGVTFVAVVLIALDAFKTKLSADAFEFNGKYKLNVFSGILAAGFFAEFINRCISVYYALDSTKYLVALSVSIRAFAAAFALLSATYFVFVSIYFSGGHYDFRSFKVLHLAPVLWTAARLLEAMEQAGVNALDGTGELLKYIMLAVALGFFFCFAREVENKNGANRVTLLFSTELAFFSMLYIADSAFTVSERAFQGISFEVIFALTAAALCLFSFAFGRNMINNTDTEN